MLSSLQREYRGGAQDAQSEGSGCQGEEQEGKNGAAPRSHE